MKIRETKNRITLDNMARQCHKNITPSFSMYYFHFIYWYIPDRYSHKHILRCYMANICVLGKKFTVCQKNEKYLQRKLIRKFFDDLIKNFRSINKHMLGLHLWVIINGNHKGKFIFRFWTQRQHLQTVRSLRTQQFVRTAHQLKPSRLQLRTSVAIC